MSYASTWILAALRNDTFFSLADAKEAVAEKLELLNSKPFKKREGNRREAYLLEEKEFMQPLPANPYEPSVWSEQTILLDYTVTDGLNKYSVPYDLEIESAGVIRSWCLLICRKTIGSIWPIQKMILRAGLSPSVRTQKKSYAFSLNPEGLPSRVLNSAPASKSTPSGINRRA